MHYLLSLNRIKGKKGKMKEESILKEKSFKLGLKVMEICRFLKESKAEFVLQRQLYRSGTAIGALIAEAEFAQSKADFISKLSIALKEANETKYWMALLCGGQIVREQSIVEASELLSEIIRMLVASLKTAKGGTAPK
jgi:four helix bundle protein